MKNSLALKPQDYIVFKEGLKIENISKDNLIEFELPKKYTVTKIKTEIKEV